MTKYLLLALGVVLVAALGLTIDVRSRTPIRRDEDRRGQENVISATGCIEGAAPEAALRPQLSGRIAEVLVHEGQMVAAGEVLLRLDDAEYRQEVALAAADVNVAEAQLQRLLSGAHPQERSEATALYEAKKSESDGAERTYKRLSELRQSRAISEQEADNQRARVAALRAEVEAAKAHLDLLQSPAREDEVAIARARIEAAKARLDLAQVQLDRTQLRAPSGGQILKRGVEPGELAGPNSTSPAIVLADISRYFVRAFVEELDAPRVQVGMLAKIAADGLPGQELKGRVTRLSPRMGHKELHSDQPAERFDTKTRDVWIELEPGPPLVVGLRVDVTIDADCRTPKDAQCHTSEDAQCSTPEAAEPTQSEKDKPDSQPAAEPKDDKPDAQPATEASPPPNR